MHVLNMKVIFSSVYNVAGSAVAANRALAALQKAMKMGAKSPPRYMHELVDSGCKRPLLSLLALHDFIRHRR